MLQWLKDTIQSFGAWLWGAILAGVDAIVSALKDFVVAAVALIPVPDAFASAQSAWTDVVSAVGFYLAPWHVGAGLTMFFSALALRWFIRRIPGS